jgi:hypothetical protein
MAMAVTDLVLPYLALPGQPRQPTASLFYQGIVRSGMNRRRSGQRSRLGMPSQDTGEHKGCRRRDSDDELAHINPLCLEDA